MTDCPQHDHRQKIIGRCGLRESNQHRCRIYPNVMNETKPGPPLPHAPHAIGELMSFNYNTPIITGIGILKCRFLNSFELV